MSRFAFALPLAAALALGMSALHAGPAASQDAGALAAGKCTACHDARRICSRLGKQPAAYWQDTVARMKTNGAKIDDAQAAAIAGYLATQAEGAKPLCP